VVAVEPETDAEEKTSNDENPDRCVGFLGDNASGVGVVSRNPGADGVGNCRDELACFANERSRMVKAYHRWNREQWTSS
jgi:hypothetical protein